MSEKIKIILIFQSAVTLIMLCLYLKETSRSNLLIREYAKSVDVVIAAENNVNYGVINKIQLGAVLKKSKLESIMFLVNNKILTHDAKFIVFRDSDRILKDDMLSGEEKDAIRRYMEKNME